MAKILACWFIFSGVNGNWRQVALLQFACDGPHSVYSRKRRIPYPGWQCDLVSLYHWKRKQIFDIFVRNLPLKLTFNCRAWTPLSTCFGTTMRKSSITSEWVGFQFKQTQVRAFDFINVLSLNDMIIFRTKNSQPSDCQRRHQGGLRELHLLSSQCCLLVDLGLCLTR